VSDALIETKDLWAGYTSLPVIRDINVHVGAGEVVALMGGNGAGKTVLLRTLAGVLKPLQGEILWRGVPAKGPLHKRVRDGLGFVTESRAIFRSLSVASNLRLGRGSPERAVDYFPELASLMRRKAGLLSGGEQQMLSLGRALAADPSLLLADELSLGLAPLIVQRLLTALEKARDEGAGILLVEQHANVALSIANRAYVLQRGRVVLEGPASELRDRVSELRHTYLAAPESATA
jgi:branched-chain amino acid transport system ATP-binding protein